ncbi:MAG TPA: hypothetical protein VFN10_09615 [Thermoanaerobaculia bacterium]|nr:hypothetical protein [Thermoanaerobaculia bacterium]
MDRIIKFVIAIVVVIAVWKYVLPWAKQEFGGGGAKTHASSDNSCVKAGQRASERFGSGIGRFVNPPVDQAAWAEFQSDVASRISSAESACTCDADSCRRVQNAMRELRSLSSDLDSAVRAGSAPPSDIVQRQEAVDNQLDEAADLARAGK